MKNGEYQLQKTNQKRTFIRKRKMESRSGSVEWAAGLFFLLFLIILLCAEIQLSIFQTTSLYLEDALAASNLASAVIDIEEYGISHTVKIINPAEAYKRYKEAVRENLQLNDEWECMNTALISGKVTVEDYTIYNVDENVISMIHVSEGGQVRLGQGAPGRVKAPNGVMIEKTGIYSEISYPVNGFLGIAVQAHKGKLVDIAAEHQTDGKDEKTQDGGEANDFSGR